MCSMNDIRKIVLHALKMILIVAGLSLPIETLFANTTDCNNPDSITGIVTYDTTDNNSYCELCGIGQIRLVVTNPTHEDMANFSISHIFSSNELEYVPGSTQGGGDPVISNGGRTLTWTSAQISGLAQIDGKSNHTDYNTVEIIFQVRSRSGTEENLVNIDRNIEATADFDFCPLTTNTSGSVSSGLVLLPIHEPIPSVIKLGRNVDASQDSGSYSSTVYGNINDDVIWRIQISNSGLADLEDLKFDDLMQNGNFQINYACPTEAEASTIAAANGAGPVGNCINSSNNITNFAVDDPFGNPANDESASFVDVPAAGSTYIYLVGKITSSCETNKTNTVDNVEWGCEVIPSDGGITQTSSGSSPGSSTTTLSSLTNNSGLQIQRALTGLNTSQPVGSRGLMTITISNNSGGSVKNFVLTDTLPVEYVVDSTFTPTLTVTTPYGDYPGLVDTLTVSSTPADPLDFTTPVFTLTSSTVHPDYPDQLNMLRHGDVATIRFRVVMIPPDHFDINSDLDVREENTTDTTDPANRHSAGLGNQLTNQLDVTFNNFCDGVLQSLTFNDLFDAFPEDLDIDITGTELIFILTNDPDQALPLQVTVTNNGGHYADDYYAYISFGTTMDVITAPAGCSVTTNPPMHEVWDDPADIPASATVYVCDHNSLGTIAPNGGQAVLDFEVIKTSDAARLAEDDLSFRADVVGEIALSDNTLTGSGPYLTFPAPSTSPINNRANNYSFDGIRARIIGFNLTKNQFGNCTENNPPPASPDILVQIGEECTVDIETGGWFGFQTPGFTYIAVQNIQVFDELPDGQGYISSTDPSLTSDPEILGISLNPPPSPLDEGTFDWTFNTVVPGERISERDKWFRAKATTRFLNDPIDNRAAPNIHAAISRNVLNSTFDAVFQDSDGNEEVYNLGPNTVGYPIESIRRVDLTITEPNILVTKEVCNESLNGTGTACSNFVTTADDGDTQDSYIYRITLTNQASASSVTRAPAYDVITTDTLDASDLVYVVPFATDGLDNDGDGDIDGADANGEGTINDNTLANSIPAIITNSYTHSSALLKIDPGSSVTFYYRVDPSDDVAPLQQLINNVLTTYDSMENISGSQTVVLGTNSTAGGARVYTSATATATVQILPLQTVPKEITRLANTTLAGSPQEVSVGEEIEYQLKAFIPVANLDDFFIRDTLPAGITCSEAPIVDLDAPPYSDAGFFPGGQITPTCSNTEVYWYFGNQELTTATSNNLFEFAVRFIARVDNTAAVNEADVISNGTPSTNVYLSYDDDTGTQITLDFSNMDVVVREPVIVLSKTFETAVNDAADVITVTVTATNTGTAPAYNLQVFDDLAAVSNLTFLNNVGGTDPPDNVDVTTFGANRPLFSWNSGNADYVILPGETKLFTFDISVDLAVQPREVLDNTIQSSWQSLPSQNTALNSSGFIGINGSTTGMRNGAIPNTGDAVNDYETTATTSSTVPAVTLTKTDLDATQLPEVGVHKNFEIVINLPEGTTNNLVVNDDLNFSDISYVLTRSGIYDISYTFNDIATINNGQTPSESNLISPAPVDGAQNTITWDFGKVVTATEDDTTGTPAINPSITINYYARIDNSITTNRDDRLQNQVTTNYTNGETAATETLINTTPIQIVTESVLALTKSSTPVTALPITSGDIIEYLITISNAGGNAKAYDLNIVDTLPDNLGLDSSFTPTATINGIDVVGFNPDPSGSPNGPLIWGRGNADNSIDIPAGETLLLTYQVTLQAGAEAGLDYTNSVIVDWTSLDGASSYERTGAGCPTITAPNDYCVGPVTSTITTADTNAFMKEIIYDSYATTNDATVRIGDNVIYRLSLILQEGTTRNVNVQDVLPAGLSFVKVISINGDTVADYDPPASGAGSNFSYSTIAASSLPAVGDTGTLNFPIGDVINDPDGDATTDTLVIEYQVVVLNDTIAQIPTTTLTNTATLQFIDGNGTAVVDPSRLEKTADLTVIQPILTMAKTASAAVIQIATPITYTLKVQNTGDSLAWDTTIVDVLPTFDPAAGGMCDTAPTNIVVRMYDSLGTTPVAPALVQGTDYIVNYSGCTLTLTMQTTDAAIAADNNLIITYESELDSDTPHSSVLTNIAGATQWFSQDTAGAGATGEIQTYSRTITNGTVGTIDHEDAYSITSDTPTVTIEKQVINVTTGQDPGTNATPGDTLRYGIYITNTSNVELFDFSFVDELDALNASARFAAGTLNLITVPLGADTGTTDANGGSKGSGLIDIRKLALGVAGSANDSILIEFEVQLVSSIPDATVVLNQGTMTTNGLNFLTDDPNVGGATDPTETLIGSAPAFEVKKISTDLTGDPAVLFSGDTLRYTITVKNIGTEDTINTLLRDQLPANTTYIADSTTLNGTVVTEPTPGTLPLQTGILINAPENATAGEMRADATATTANVATITFDVTINANVVNGTIISNQAYVSADGVASGAIADQPSDDPDTVTSDDPTIDVVGNQPLLDALKTVAIVVDNGTTGILDPNDIIRYTITISNIGAADATLVTFTDAVPTYTTYIADSVTLNGLPVAQPDGGVSPLITGIDVSSSDLTPPLPTAGNGVISRDQSAVITFDVQVDAAVAVGTIISNQGFVDSYELPTEPTDADGIDSNGDQPTLIVVGNEQLLSITKSVSVVGGGAAVAGGQLEYRILVTNISSVAATNVTITDNLDSPVAGQLTYVNGSGLLNGLATGVSYSAPIITADYATSYGNLLQGETAELVFRVTINNSLPLGTTITNTGVVSWDAATKNASATISIDVGGTPGVANVNGKIWHDKSYDNIFDSGELVLEGWFVDIYRNTTLLGTVTSDASGNYSINGLTANDIGSDRYDIRFRAPGSNNTSAKLGNAYSDPALAYSNDLHRIYNIVLSSGSNVQDLNLPIDPNGVVYNSVVRSAISGATISLLNAGTGSEISSSCFDDVNQQNQVTTTNGYYKFDLNFSQGDCTAGADYLIRITPPASGYNLNPSTVITPQTDATTAAFDVPNCPGTADDDVATPVGYCEVQVSELAPALSIAPASAGTSYYLHLTLNNGSIPGDSQIFNNHLPIDPILTNAVSITKTSAFVNVVRGKLVPYTITITNNFGVILIFQ